MAKVQFHIEGEDAADVLRQLKELTAALMGGVPASQAAQEAPSGRRGGKAKADTDKPAQAAPAAEENDPFAGNGAADASQKADTTEAVGSGASGAASSGAIDLEDGDDTGEDGEPTYEVLSKAMGAALERVNGDPLVVQQALFAATGAKALKQLTTNGVKGGPITPGKGASALAAFEAIGRD